MALLLLSQREAHAALPNTLYCLGSPGLGWPFQPMQLVRDFTRRAEIPPVPLQWQNQPLGAGLEEVNSMAFSAELGGECAKHE